MAAPLLEHGSNPDDLMGFLYALALSRHDTHYLLHVRDLMADVEQSIAGNLDHEAKVQPLEPEEIRWCRYVEEHFLQEYLQ